MLEIFQIVFVIFNKSFKIHLFENSFNPLKRNTRNDQFEKLNFYLCSFINPSDVAAFIDKILVIK